MAPFAMALNVVIMLTLMWPEAQVQSFRGYGCGWAHGRGNSHIALLTGLFAFMASKHEQVS